MYHISIDTTAKDDEQKHVEKEKSHKVKSMFDMTTIHKQLYICANSIL